MTSAVLAVRPDRSAARADLLDIAVRVWFVVTVVGQALFAWYIGAFYAGSSLRGDFAAWSLNRNLIKGYVAGDAAGNLAFASHVLLALIVTALGALQLVPQIRARAPWLHRWTGRLFLTSAIAAGVAGLYMVWVRGAVLSPVGGIAIGLNAVLLVLFAVFAWRAALRGDFESHPRWALRTFIVANGVWFMRIFLMPWAMAVMAMSGAKLSPTQPMFHVLEFASYLLPLLVLEIYLRARGRNSRTIVAGVLFASSAVIAAGAASAWLLFWSPVLAKL